MTKDCHRRVDAVFFFVEQETAARASRSTMIMWRRCFKGGYFLVMMMWKGDGDVRRRPKLQCKSCSWRLTPIIYNARGGYLLRSSLANHEDYVVFDVVGDIDAAKLERAHPACDFFGA